MKNLFEKNLKSEKGAVMVEASIYFPIVLGIVMAVIYVSLWKIQDCASYFAAQKVANSAAAAMQHEDFDMLYGTSDKVTLDTTVDFSYEADSVVPESYVKDYYKGSNSNGKKLYTRVKINSLDYEKSLRKLIDQTKFVPFKLENDDVDVEINSGLLRSYVTVDVAIGFDTPGIMKYIGFDDEFKFHSKGYQFVTEPVEFIRNTDLAVDLIEYLFDRLGITDKIEAFTSKFNGILTKLGISKE